VNLSQEKDTDQCASGDGLLDVRGAGEKKCEDKSQICCHKSSLKQNVREEEYQDYYDQTLCSDLEAEGYRCVANEKCDKKALLNQRNDINSIIGGGQDLAVCEDDSQTCCPKDFVKDGDFLRGISTGDILGEGENEISPEDSKPSKEDEDYDYEEPGNNGCGILKAALESVPKIKALSMSVIHYLHSWMMFLHPWVTFGDDTFIHG